MKLNLQKHVVVTNSSVKFQHQKVRGCSLVRLLCSPTSTNSMDQKKRKEKKKEPHDAIPSG